MSDFVKIFIAGSLVIATSMVVSFSSDHLQQLKFSNLKTRSVRVGKLPNFGMPTESNEARPASASMQNTKSPNEQYPSDSDGELPTSNANQLSDQTENSDNTLVTTPTTQMQAQRSFSESLPSSLMLFWFIAWACMGSICPPVFKFLRHKARDHESSNNPISKWTFIYHVFGGIVVGVLGAIFICRPDSTSRDMALLAFQWGVCLRPALALLGLKI